MNSNFALTLALATCLAGSAPAQTAAPAPAPPAAPPTAAPMKVATIHVQDAIMRTKEGQKAAQELQTRFTPRKQVLEKKQSDIVALQQQMRAGGATMSQAARDKLTRDIDASSTSLKRDTEDFQAEVQQEEGKIMNDLGQKMMEILGKYATQNGVAMVIDVSNQQSPVLWADASLDITTEIIKEYDAAHPVVAAAPAAPAPPATKK